jgi:hypothetical protein
MLRHVALVRTDVSEEFSASIISVTRIGKLGTTLAVTSNRRTLRRNTKLLVTVNDVPSQLILVTLMMEALSSSGTSVPTRATRRNNREDTILHSHRRENLKSYTDINDFNFCQILIMRCGNTNLPVPTGLLYTNSAWAYRETHYTFGGTDLLECT